MPTRGEIDRIGEQLRQHPTPEAIGRYIDYRESLAASLDEVEAAVRVAVPGRAVIGRRKTADSTIAKLQRMPGLRLSRMQDAAGCRVIVQGLREQDAAVKALLERFPDARVDDLRIAPHSGYRAVHVIARTGVGEFVEIQVRTELQHQWADMSEKVAYALGMEVKYGGGSDPVRDVLDTASDAGHHLEMALASPSIDVDEDELARLESELRDLFAKIIEWAEATK